MPHNERIIDKDDPELQAFFEEMEKRCKVTREQLIEAIGVVGFIKSRIETYFIVEKHLRKKGR